jgi:hypothetical protein
MGKTFKKQASIFDDEVSGKRSGKHAKHTNGKKTGGMKTLNSYVEFDLNDDDFDDEVGIQDDIKIQHNTDTN